MSPPWWGRSPPGHGWVPSVSNDPWWPMLTSVGMWRPAGVSGEADECRLFPGAEPPPAPSPGPTQPPEGLAPINFKASSMGSH